MISTDSKEFAIVYFGIQYGIKISKAFNDGDIAWLYVFTANEWGKQCKWIYRMARTTLKYQSAPNCGQRKAISKEIWT